MVDVLNKVPREMLLIFKTNDCLRGIDSSLRTRFRSNAFVGMTRSCTAVLYDERIMAARNSLQRFYLYVEKAVVLLALDISSFMIRFYSVTT